MTLADHARLGIEALLQGRLDEAETHLARAEQAFRAVGQEEQAAGISIARARVALLRGDRLGAEARLQQVERAGARSPAVQGQVELLRARLAEGQADAETRIARARQALAQVDPERLQGRLQALEAALPEALPPEKGHFLKQMVQQLQALSEGATRLQLGRLAFQAGDPVGGKAEIEAFLQGAEQPQDQALGYLMMSAGLEQNGLPLPALEAARRARSWAVQAKEAQLYQHAALSICRLEGQLGDRVEQFLAAARAWKSLEALQGEGAGRLFQELLEAFKADWGEEVFRAVAEEAAGRGGR